MCRRPGFSLVGGLLLALWFGLPGLTGAQEGREAGQRALLPIPEPALAGLEPAVAEQLGAARARLARGQAEGSAAATEFGELGLVYQAYGFSEPAEAAYENASRLAPRDFRWRHLLGLVLEDRQRLDEAAQAYSDAFALGSFYPSLLRWARVEQGLGRLKEAGEVLAAAAAHAPNDPALLALQGEQARLTGQPAQAVELLGRALALAPGATRLHYPLALALRALGRGDEAKGHLAQVGRVGIVPLDPLLAEVEKRRLGATPWELEGQKAFRAGDFAGAAQAFGRALSAQPGNPSLLAELGAAEARAGQVAAALDHYRQAVERAPERLAARFSLGSLLLSNGQAAEAVPHLQAVLAASAGDNEARELLALAHTRLGNTESALETLQPLPQLAPTACQSLLATSAAQDSRFAERLRGLGCAQAPPGP